MKLRIGLWAGAAALVWAASTTTWEMSGYQEFLRGRFAGVSLSRDGELMLAPRLETVVASDQPVIWSLVRAPDGTLYAGTGHAGRVLKVDPSGRSSVLWTAAQPEVFALALGPDGLLYAGTSPNGKVYRINARGEASEFFAPGATYIWALAFDRNGALYVGTGDQGKIFRVEPSGKGEVYYETGQIHVTCLGWDAEGRLVAGTDPNGILYRISGKDKGFVLYDANLPEIRSIALGPDGALYAAALGGAALRRTPAVPPSASGTQGAPAGAAATVTVTVSEEGAQGGVEIKPKPEAAKPASGPAAPPPAPAPVVDLAGVEKSAVFRIAPDLTVETLWTSKEENVYDLALLGEDLILGTDGRGRLYRLARDRKVTLLAETNESEATRLAVSAGGVLAATGNLGKIFRVGREYATAGEYESPVHDAGSVARWGRISWRAETGQEGRIVLRTRTGNSARPDRTWSEWSEPLTDASGSLIPSPNARYIQWRAEFSGTGRSSPVLRSVTVAYLPQNTPPVVKSVTVSAVSGAATPQRAAGTAASSSTYSITVTDTGEPPAATSSGTPAQTVGRAGSGQLQVSWQAEDADGDRLSYAVYFRGEEERQWKLIKDNLSEASVQIDREALADGRYFFRVVASDQAANPPATARQGEMISAPVLIDNTPPKVRLGTPRRAGMDVEIEVEATDEASALRRAEYSVDAGPWTPLPAEDGVADSPRERFLLRVVNPPPGEHVVVVRVHDAADNAGLAKVVLR